MTPPSSDQLNCAPMSAPFVNGREVCRATIRLSKTKAAQLSRELDARIVQNTQDDRLKWYPDGTVEILFDRCIKARDANTHAGQDLVFACQLIPLLEQAGWDLVGSDDTYLFYKPERLRNGCPRRAA